ncbi:MAG: hypothetical protein NTZ09_16545, partial [Candidatus Hydrogenedentes bacterium]|nr:hypothetical protein [Candidatus Hydrogenedentota bacterium]
MALQTVKERMLAVLQGREHDRVPFAQYVLSQHHCQSFPLKKELWDTLGPDNVGQIRLSTAFGFKTPNCRFEHENIVYEGRDAVRHTMITPLGALNEVRLYEESMKSTAAATHYVKTEDDYKILLSYLKDIEVVEDLRDFNNAVEELGDYGLAHCCLPRTPFQQTWIQWTDMRDLAVHLAMAPDIMDEVFTAIQNVNYRVYEVVAGAIQHAPIPYLVFGDNLTAPMIGDRYFRKHNVPAYNKMVDMIAETGVKVPVFVHTDGYLKALWEAFDECRVDGLESLSPPPDNDTSVAVASARWPNMRFLVNFPSPAHMLEPNEIY